MKISIKNLKPGQLKLLQLEEGLGKSLRNSFFLVSVFLVAACSPELQEQAGVVERVSNPVETKFEKWYQTEHKEILETPSNARMQFDPSVRLTYRYKEVDWSSYKKLNLPSKLEIYEFDFLASNVVVPFDFKEEFGYNEALKRSKQTLLIFAQGNEVVKSYVIRYYFSGEKVGIADFQKINYDAVDKNWKGQIDLYSLNEIHLVSFDMVIGQVIGTETMKLGSQDDIHPSQSASTTCSTIWTEGPCEPIPGETGVVCYDTFTTYCYNSSPPLISGFPAWNGSGGFVPGGSGGPADQSICDFDPTCIPYPDSMDDAEESIQKLIEGITDPEQKRKAQLDYLRNRGGSDFVKIIEELLNTSGLTIGDVEEINNVVNGFYLRQKGLFMMNIFSPENVAQVLTLALSNISVNLRNKIFSFFPQYTSYGNLAALIGNKTFFVNGRIVVFKGLTEHGVKRAIERGISEERIIDTLNFGSQTIKNGQYGTPHIHFIYKELEIVVEAGTSSSQLGKIITIMI
ncbi:MAG: hypothetical protein RLZZ358_1579 [Bacteroidota bacterium]